MRSNASVRPHRSGTGWGKLKILDVARCISILVATAMVIAAAQTNWETVAILIGAASAVIGVFYERHAEKGKNRLGLNLLGWAFVVVIVIACFVAISQGRGNRVEAKRREDEAKKDAAENRERASQLHSQINGLVEELKKSTGASSEIVRELEKKIDGQRELTQQVIEHLKKTAGPSLEAARELERKIDGQRELTQQVIEQLRKTTGTSPEVVRVLSMADSSWEGGVISIPIGDASGTRLTDNFVGPPGSGERSVKLEILNVPREQVKSIRMQLKLDKPHATDPDRSPIVGDGDIITLEASRTGYYFAGRENAEAVLRSYPMTLVRLTLQSR